MKTLMPAILFCAACGTTPQPNAAAATLPATMATGCDTGCCEPDCCDDPSCCVPGCCATASVAAAKVQPRGTADNGCCPPGSDCCPDRASQR